MRIEQIGYSDADLVSELLKTVHFRNHQDLTPKLANEFAVVGNQLYNAENHRERLLKKCNDLQRLEIANANALDPDLGRITLYRTVHGQEMLRAFKARILALTTFSASFEAALEGTDLVGVPFYPLQTAAATSFDGASGYSQFADTVTQIRKVKVGGAGTAASGANAPANTANDRLYLGIKYSSYELRRIPFFDALAQNVQNADKLGIDIYTQIVSRVITATNYGASIKSEQVDLFDGSDIADIYGSVEAANWPLRNRSLTLDSTYKRSLLKDPTFKYALSCGSNDTLRRAAIQEAYGFEDINTVPNLTTYSPVGENLVGFANHKAAMLVATAVIEPAPEVKKLLSLWQIFTDEDTGISFCIRGSGDAFLDQSKNTIECSFGANVGITSALLRITKP